MVTAEPIGAILYRKTYATGPVVVFKVFFWMVRHPLQKKLLSTKTNKGGSEASLRKKSPSYYKVLYINLSSIVLSFEIPDIYNTYRTEADQQKVKLQKMKDDGKDEYDIRKMNEVLQE